MTRRISGIKRVLFVTQDVEEIGRGGRVYGPILTVNGHNFYGWVLTNTFYNFDKYILLFWQIQFGQIWGKVVMSSQSENTQKIQNFIVQNILLLPFSSSFTFFKKSRSLWMMLSVLHFVMGDFLHEKVVTQREPNIKARLSIKNFFL